MLHIFVFWICSRPTFMWKWTRKAQNSRLYEYNVEHTPWTVLLLESRRCRENSIVSWIKSFKDNDIIVFVSSRQECQIWLKELLKLLQKNNLHFNKYKCYMDMTFNITRLRSLRYNQSNYWDAETYKCIWSSKGLIYGNKLLEFHTEIYYENIPTLRISQEKFKILLIIILWSCIHLIESRNNQCSGVYLSHLVNGEERLIVP